MNKLKDLIYTALFIAIGIVLPLCFHSIPSSGNIFLPMHLPVILAGALLGIIPGIIVGVATPLISFLISSMPSAVVLPGMLFELATYGFMMGLLTRLIKLKNIYLKIYIALIISMLFGRTISGIMNAFIFQVGTYNFSIWLSLSFIIALPGIVIQLIVVPSVYVLFNKLKSKMT